MDAQVYRQSGIRVFLVHHQYRESGFPLHSDQTPFSTSSGQHPGSPYQFYGRNPAFRADFKVGFIKATTIVSNGEADDGR